MKKQAIVVLAVSAAAVFGSNAAFASAELAKAKNCMACHTTDKKLVGPSYVDVATKYATDKGAEAALTKQIREGGSGKWGPVPMPAQPQVTPAEAAQLAKWILSLKK